MMKIQIQNTIIELIQGDITDQETDAIVNAANSEFILGAGVAGAIKKKGGPSIQEACNTIGHCPVGGAVITTGGNLKARHVIHVVGPRMGEGDEETQLTNTTRSCLQCADENRLPPISLPAIGSGIFGFPIGACARIMLDTACDHCYGSLQLQRIVFTLCDRTAYDVFEKSLEN